MLCPNCNNERQDFLVYIVSWQKWRYNRLEDWKNERKRSNKNVRFDKKTRDYINEYTKTGYIGYICHDCNKKTNIEERELFDRIINTIENKGGVKNEPQNTL